MILIEINLINFFRIKKKEVTRKGNMYCLFLVNQLWL